MDGYLNIFISFSFFLKRTFASVSLGVDPKVLKFDKVHMRTHRRSGLLISKIALEKLFIYLINCAGVTQQNLVSPKSRFLSHSHYLLQ